MRIFLGILSILVCEADEYHESLYLEPLAGEKVLAELSFDFQKSSQNNVHHRVYPRVIHEITSKFDLSELRLSISRGGEDGFQWSSKMESPPGAFLAATFDSTQNITTDERWKSLVGVLAGLFCISLNQLNLESSISPLWPLPSFMEIDDLNQRRMGFLPREVACTENLTPWKKILPTGGDHGLVNYLSNAHHQLRQSSYWSLELDFHTRESTNFLSLKHTMVIDVRQADELRYASGKEATSSIVINSHRLFGIKSFIPTAAAKSTTLVLVQNPTQNVKISTKTFDKMNLALQNETSDNMIWKMNFQNEDFAIRMQWNDDIKTNEIKNYIKVSRFNGGKGQGHGKVISKIDNKFDHDKTVLTLEVIPWWLIPEMGKMRLRNCEKVNAMYVPADDHLRKTASLMLVLTIPAGTSCWVEYDYTTAWPKWTEYPPDANHGRYLPSLMALYSQGEITRRTFSGSLLIYVPIPDFSMPYNVLCLVCTVIAMGIGAVHNLTTSQLVSSSTPKPDTNLGKLINVILTILKKLKAKILPPKIEPLNEKPQATSNVEEKPADKTEAE